MKYLIVILLFVNSSFLLAQHIAVKRNDNNYRRLLKLDLNDNKTETLYTSNYEHITDIAVSSTGVLGTNKIRSSMTVGYNKPVNTVYDVEKGVVVQTFAGLVYHSMLEKWTGGGEIILGEPAGKINQITTQLIKITIPEKYNGDGD